MAQTIDHILRQAMTALAASPSPRLDAEVFVMHVTGLTRAQLITHGDQALTAEQETLLNTLLARRAQGEPVAYLTGEREFWSLPLHVTPAVLIPRADTELLVEVALEKIPREASWTIADLGTGSGAVALAIAHDRPRCHVLALDQSGAAIAVARDNAQRLGLANVECLQGNWFEPLAGMTVDLLAGNPPYIAERDPHLSQGDVRFEPRAALASGIDGLDDIRHLVAQAGAYLRAGGWLMLEHGFDQGNAVRALFAAAGFLAIETRRDASGLERVTLGCRP
jgi:release factor glutamine methyltransferase